MKGSCNKRSFTCCKHVDKQLWNMQSSTAAVMCKWVTTCIKWFLFTQPILPCYEHTISSLLSKHLLTTANTFVPWMCNLLALLFTAWYPAPGDQQAKSFPQFWGSWNAGTNFKILRWLTKTPQQQWKQNTALHFSFLAVEGMPRMHKVVMSLQSHKVISKQ